MAQQRLRADFNGLFGDLLCLSHSDTTVDSEGNIVHLSQGLHVTVYDEDLDDQGNRDDLLATGIVEKSPPWIACNGSRWVLRIDGDGVRNESEIPAESDDSVIEQR